MDRNLADALILAPPPLRDLIATTLERFGEAALHFAQTRRIRIVALEPKQLYREKSMVLRQLAIDVDAWKIPPAGLFVVEERTMYLRSCTAMTIAHEFGHALDCALGEGVYISSSDARLRTLFAAARAWVTPYAATRIDEYFAEALRAYVEANDPTSPWPRATRQRLRIVDPALFAYIEELFLTRFSISAPASSERFEKHPPGR